jgi:hypothetical protein
MGGFLIANQEVKNQYRRSLVLIILFLFWKNKQGQLFVYKRESFVGWREYPVKRSSLNKSYLTNQKRFFIGQF